MEAKSGRLLAICTHGSAHWDLVYIMAGCGPANNWKIGAESRFGKGVSSSDIPTIGIQPSSPLYVLPGFWSPFSISKSSALCTTVTHEFNTWQAPLNKSPRGQSQLDVTVLWPDILASQQFLGHKDLFRRLPAAKITQIKEFTPAAWAKAEAKEKVVARQLEQTGRLSLAKVRLLRCWHKVQY